MRRAAALAAACVAALALLAAAPSVLAPPLAGAGTASAKQGEGRCAAWKQHRKRVVRRVRRHGEWKRAVRIKRWRTCRRRAAAAPALPAAPGGPLPVPTPPVPTPPAPEDPTLERLSVKAVEWAYTLSRPAVPAGEIVVELNNAGEDPHNLNLQAEGSGPEGQIATIGPGQQGKAKFALAAGAYRLWCDLDEHAERGMEATLIVSE